MIKKFYESSKYSIICIKLQKEKQFKNKMVEIKKEEKVPESQIEELPQEISFYPMAVLIEELKSKDIKRRVNSIKNLSSIAVALGPEKTRNELLSFINDLLDDEEEVLVSLAEILGKFIEFVGGPQYAMNLIKPLELLTKAEENSIREKAIESIKKVLSEISIKECESEVMEIIRRLSSDKWYTSKIASVSLIPSIFLQVKQEFQKELIAVYKQCAKDEVPQVRRIAASSLKDFAGLIPEFTDKDALEMFTEFNKDEQDSVRLMSIENLLALSKAVPKIVEPILKDSIKLWAEEKSWRVRYILAEKIVEFAKILDKEYVNTVLCEYFLKFLQENEAEVRTISALKIGDFLGLLEMASISKILPIIKKLSTDTQSNVRKSLAESLPAIAQNMKNENHKENLIPLISSLLSDDNNEVCITCLNSFENLLKIIEKETFIQGISPAIEKQLSDQSWRIRVSLINSMDMYAKIMGEKDFSIKFISIIEKLLDDKTYIVRETILEQIKKLVIKFGYQWGKEKIIPKILSYSKHANYLFRSTAAFGIQKLLENAPIQEIYTIFLPIICDLIIDKVPNIRIIAGKCLLAIKTKIEENAPSEIMRKIENCVEKIKNDTDQDVRKLI